MILTPKRYNSHGLFPYPSSTSGNTSSSQYIQLLTNISLFEQIFCFIPFMDNGVNQARLKRIRTNMRVDSKLEEQEDNRV